VTGTHLQTKLHFCVIKKLDQNWTDGGSRVVFLGIRQLGVFNSIRSKLKSLKHFVPLSSNANDSGKVVQKAKNTSVCELKILLLLEMQFFYFLTCGHLHFGASPQNQTPLARTKTLNAIEIDS
jgi:hypothetical protein